MFCNHDTLTDNHKVLKLKVLCTEKEEKKIVWECDKKRHISPCEMSYAIGIPMGKVKNESPLRTLRAVNSAFSAVKCIGIDSSPPAIGSE
jgi:hypothetical protein